MNTIAATWGGGLRERIGELGLRIERLGQRLAAWGAVKKNPYPKTREEFEALIAALPTSDLKLKPEVEAELMKEIEEAERGIGVSPAFGNTEDAIAYLHEEARKYREEESSQ